MIDNVTTLLPSWLERNFAGLSRPELRAACVELQINVASGDTIDSLTRKLLQFYNRWDTPEMRDAASPTAKVGQLSDAVQAAAKPKAAPKAKAPSNMPAAPVGITPVRTPPNLRSLSKWEGRRYRIRAMAQDRQAGGSRKIPVAWEGDVFWLDPKAPYQDIPAPVFYNIMDSQARQLILEWDGVAKLMNRTWNVFARFPIQFIGITPNTAHLPEDLRGWYQTDAQTHDLYAGESRDALERIWMALTDGSRPNDRDRDRNRDYWRYEILQLLGLTPEQQEQDRAREALAA